MNSKPILIGAGLTGMVISDQLSKQGISHVLIGDPPDDAPRLGESLDVSGTLGLLESYPEFEEFYHRKEGISVFTGDFATVCDFSETLPRSVGLRLMGFQSPPELIDMDRIGFDRALYERVAASDYCTHIESLVDTVDYHEETDTIEAVHLKNGASLDPSYVFDCTNYVRLLGRALDVPVEWISEPQRVVFTDYYTATGDGRDGLLAPELKHSDHLVRLYRDIDGLDGLAWAIPIDSYVSVGVSMPLGQDAPETDTVLSRVEAAYRRRGMELLETFDDPKPAVDIPRHRYFIHDRAYGQNWLLAGPAYGQFWFPTASGVATSIVAAYFSTHVIDTPSAAKRYQDYVDGIRETHHIFDRVITLDHDELSESLVRSEIDRIFAENVKRLGRLANIRRGPFASGMARLFMTAAEYDGVIQGDCQICHAEFADQAQALFDDV